MWPEPDILKDILGSKDPLHPTIQLSEIFSAPLHQQLHIIVGAVSASAKVDTTLMGSVPPLLLLLVVCSELQVTLPGLITLHCLVHPCDNPLQQIFSITIDKNKRAFDLKVFIKKKRSPEFDHLPMINLWLYRTSLPGNDEFQQQIDDPNLDDK